MRSRFLQLSFFAAFLLSNMVVKAQTPTVLVTPDGHMLTAAGGGFILVAPAAPNDAPVADAVTITYSPALGQPVVGQTLTASYTYTDTENDPQGTATYQWYWASDPIFGTPTAIVGATTSSYLLTSADFGRYIKVGVTPVATSGTSTGVEAESGYVGSISNPLCPATLTVSHTVDGVSPVAGSITYGVVESNLTGAPHCWIAQNLGATQQATSATDATDASAGWYWQFNLKQGFAHNGTTRTPATTWNTSITENSDWIAADDPCTLLLGAGWRIPTSAEWTSVIAAGGWTDATGVYASALKLHAGGFITDIDALVVRGLSGRYWSSTQFNNTNATHLGFSTNCVVTSNTKSLGLSVRCLRD